MRWAARNVSFDTGQNNKLMLSVAMSASRRIKSANSERGERRAKRREKKKDAKEKGRGALGREKM